VGTYWCNIDWVEMDSIGAHAPDTGWAHCPAVLRKTIITLQLGRIKLKSLNKLVFRQNKWWNFLSLFYLENRQPAALNAWAIAMIPARNSCLGAAMQIQVQDLLVKAHAAAVSYKHTAINFILCLAWRPTTDSECSCDSCVRPSRRIPWASHRIIVSSIQFWFCCCWI
jgi:hypothetical protein